LITALNEHKEKEVEHFLKWGSAPNPVPASLRRWRQYGPVVGFGWLVLVWLVWGWFVWGWFVWGWYEPGQP
jgi:hypothetical protein